MSGHLPVERDVCWPVLGLADLLGLQSAADLGGLGAACLAENGQQDEATAWRQPVGDPGLLSE